MLGNFTIQCKALWTLVRRLSGDDAYEQYLKHYAEVHSSVEDNPEATPPSLLSREEFFKQWQDGKWKGIKRCC